MRILSAAAIAALFAVGTLSAYTPAAMAAGETAAKPKACSKRTEAECKAPDCEWKAPTGKQKKGKCVKAPKPKAAAVSKPQ